MATYEKVDRSQDIIREDSNFFLFFGLRVSVSRIEDMQTLSWVLKDAAWCALILPISIIFGILAIANTLILLYEQSANKTLLVHNIAVTSWIVGNFAWMIGEVGYDVPKAIYIQTTRCPWFGYDKAVYERSVTVAIVFFTFSNVCSLYLPK